MNTKSMSFSSPDKKYHTSEHLVYSCQYHVIFCPKYRRKVLTAPYDQRLKEILLQVAEDNGFSIPEMEVMPDHVHLIVDCSPRFGICRCIRALKGTSSKLMRQEFPELKKKLPTLWTRSCFVSSVGSVSLEVVKQYIEDQKNR